MPRKANWTLGSDVAVAVGPWSGHRSRFRPLLKADIYAYRGAAAGCSSVCRWKEPGCKWTRAPTRNSTMFAADTLRTSCRFGKCLVKSLSKLPG